MKCKIVAAALMLTASITANAAGNVILQNATAPHNSQQACTQSGTDLAPLPPNAGFNPNHVETLNRSLDRFVLKKDIVAYKIKWSTGWSGWFVKGVNDLVGTAFWNTNLAAPGNYARLNWIYFSDHQHQYIACNSL